MNHRKTTMNKTTTIYNSRMKMADLVASDMSLLSILQRLEIRLGFGEATVAEVCAQHGISAELLLMICNIYSFNSYRPKAEKLKKEDLPHILSYLRASHKHYMNNWFPRLHNNIHTCIFVRQIDRAPRRMVCAPAVCVFMEDSERWSKVVASEHNL